MKNILQLYSSQNEKYSVRTIIHHFILTIYLFEMNLYYKICLILSLKIKYFILIRIVQNIPNTPSLSWTLYFRLKSTIMKLWVEPFLHMVSQPKWKETNGKYSGSDQTRKTERVLMKCLTIQDCIIPQVVMPPDRN